MHRPSSESSPLESEEFDLGEDAPVEELHADERWLVSYADMMTLLFGFFVLLYSMAGKFDLIQKAADDEFNKGASRIEKPVPDAPVAQVPLEVLQDERQKLAVRVAELELQLKHANAAAYDGRKASEQLDKLQDQVRRQAGQITQYKSMEKEVTQLRTQVAQLNVAAMASQMAPTHGPRAQTPQARPDNLADDGTSTDDGQYKGGRGGGGQGDSFFVHAESSSGSFDARVMRISLSGLQLAQPPPESLGQKFRVTLRRDSGGAVEINVMTVPGPNGERTVRLAILEFPNGDEDVLRSWFKDSRPGGRR
jgi:flagellar motor protein MotB